MAGARVGTAADRLGEVLIMARITIVSPCFNEEDNVESCYNAIAKLFTADGPLAKHEREHIFADNASQDGTVAILRRLAAADRASRSS